MSSLQKKQQNIVQSTIWETSLERGGINQKQAQIKIKQWIKDIL